MLAIAAGAFLGFFNFAKAATGASIFLGPSNGTFTVGSTFTVSVYVNTGGNSVNAIEVNLSFPPDKLQVVSPSTGKSLMQFWVTQPSYSNEQGTIKFQGTVPTPGINTDSGLISTVTFRVKNTGQAIVRVLDKSKVLLNDGKGTDILGETAGGVYTLILPPPAGPEVVSATHSDQTRWYQSKDVTFEWEKSGNVKGFSYVLSEQPVDMPDDISEGLRSSVIYKDLADGVRYFHIKALGEYGWGGVTHFAVNIDNTPPAAFEITISPSNRTARREPVIDFGTTDSVSGIQFYELKIIPLDVGAKDTLFGPEDEKGESFFFEVTPPYYREFGLGKYDVLVRAYDQAGNYFQTSQKLTITRAIFEIIKGAGISFKGSFTIPWIYIWVFLVLVFGVLGYLGRRIWKKHKEIDEAIISGVLTHPKIADRVSALKNKISEYGKRTRADLGLWLWLGILIFGGAILFQPAAVLGADNQNSILPVEPPIVSVFPTEISNDEIFYIGGRAGAPEAEVIVYIQEEATGEASSQSIKTDKTGAWFYTSSNFFDAGEYLVWTQLKIGEAFSPPSAKLDLKVSPTAIQIGGKRINYEELYLVIMLIVLVALIGIVIFISYHFYHHRRKNQQLLKEIYEAEESIRRGFTLLKRDIEEELNLVRKIKMSKELAVEEKLREEKLIKDLEWVNTYIGKEVWDIEKKAG